MNDTLAGRKKSETASLTDFALYLKLFKLSTEKAYEFLHRVVGIMPSHATINRHERQLAADATSQDEMLKNAPILGASIAQQVDSPRVLQ